MSSSKSVKFSPTELEALNTWTDLQNFGASRSENVEVAEATQVLTVEQIETMQKQAFDEAFEQGRQQGFAQGFEQGRQEGFVEGSQKGYAENRHLLDKQCAQLGLLMEALSEPFKNLDEEVEKELVKLAIAIASQIIRRESKQDPGQIIAVIREAMQALPVASQKITLNLHPEDAELVRTSLNLDDSLPPWRLLENPLLTRGGCTVETEFSTIDATLEKRLSAVVATLLGSERREDGTR